MSVYDVVDLVWDLLDKGPTIIILEGGPRWIDIEIDGTVYRVTVEKKS